MEETRRPAAEARPGRSHRSTARSRLTSLAALSIALQTREDRFHQLKHLLRYRSSSSASRFRAPLDAFEPLSSCARPRSTARTDCTASLLLAPHSSDPLEEERRRLPAADARRADRVPLLQAVERVDEVGRDARAGRRERVAESCEKRGLAVSEGAGGRAAEMGRKRTHRWHRR